MQKIIPLLLLFFIYIPAAMKSFAQQHDNTNHLHHKYHAIKNTLVAVDAGIFYEISCSRTMQPLAPEEHRSA